MHNPDRIAITISLGTISPVRPSKGPKNKNDISTLYIVINAGGITATICSKYVTRSFLSGENGTLSNTTHRNKKGNIVQNQIIKEDEISF